MGAKGDLGEELHDDGKNKCPDLFLTLKNTEKEQQDSYSLQVLNLCRLITYANCQKSLGSAVPIPVLRNKGWTSNEATTSPLPVRVGLVCVQFQIFIKSLIYPSLLNGKPLPDSSKSCVRPSMMELNKSNRKCKAHPAFFQERLWWLCTQNIHNICLTKF